MRLLLLLSSFFSASFLHAQISDRGIPFFDTSKAIVSKHTLLDTSKIQNGQSKIKQSTQQYTDSQLLKRQKNKFNAKIDAQKSIGMNQKKALTSKITTKLPSKENLFKFSIQVRSESFATNAQNPMQRNELVYSRLYVSPKFTVLGLPFTSNLFYTTEANNTYKNNYFAFRLDVNSLRQSAVQQMQKELDEMNKLDRMRQIELNSKSIESNKLNQQMEALKQQAPDYDNWQQTLKQEAEKRVNEKLETEKKALEEQLKTATEQEKEKILNAYQHKKDSMLSSYKQSINDSISDFKTRSGEKIDTAKLNKLMVLERQYEQLQKQKEQIEALRKIDTTGMASKIQGIRSPKNIREQMQSSKPNQGMLKSVLAVDRFGIGLTGAQYTDFTLSNISLKGIDIGVSKTKYFWDATLGKTSKLFVGPFSSQKVSYNRPIGAFRLGLGERNTSYLSVTYFAANDINAVDSFLPNVNNSVISVSSKAKLIKGTIIEGEWAQSRYREEYRYRNSASNASNKLGVNATMAYQLKATHQAGKNTKLEVNLRQVGAAFRTIGNPFLRRNFREVDAKLEQMLFKQKVKLAATYKEMRDNLIEINTATNRMKGYGLKLNTSFEKYPNISLGYSPYQQGNNHPDSLYRTNNQFSITTATITYKKRSKRYSWNGMLNYTKSAMEISGRGPVAYKMISSTQSFQMGMRHQSVVSYFSNITAPFVDSLNSNSLQVNHNYLTKKGLSIGLISDYTKYKNDAFKMGGGIIITTTISRNLSLSITSRYDKIDGLWHLENKDVFTGKMVVVWRW